MISLARSGPAAAWCAVLAPLVVVAGCAGGSTERTETPAPPTAETTPSDEISPNLARALGQGSGARPTPALNRAKVARDLVGDQANAVYSGERLTGTVTAPVAPSAPTGSSVPPAPTTPPAAAAAPKPAPRVPVHQQPAPAPAPPAPATAATPTRTAGTTGGVMAQLGAFSSRDGAETGWQRIRDAHPELLGERAYTIQEADLGDRGIFYRVRTGPFADGAAAAELCERLRARDQACVIVRSP